MTQEYKVVICGAGPAGASASLFLSKEKIPHLLIDKSTFPRDKVCGDALSGKVFSHLKHVLPDVRSECCQLPTVFLPSYGVRFVAPNGKELDVPFVPNITATDPPPGFISSRLDFDDWLFQKAAAAPFAEVWQNAKLIAIAKQNGGLVLQLKKDGEALEVKTQLAIAADGERSLLRKFHTGTATRDRSSFSAGVRQYYRGVEGFHDMNFIELHFLPELLPGYFWIFPMPNGRANVGAGMLSSVVANRKVDLKKEMEKIIQEHPIISKRFVNAKPEGKTQGWGLPLGRKVGSISGDNLLLCGDAASLIDPFTGEGIGNAILSGRYAAEAALKAISTQNFLAKNLNSYDQIIRKKVGAELRLSSTLLRLCEQQWLLNFVVNKATRNPEFRDTISSMFADIDLRAKFANPIFYFKILFGDRWRLRRNGF
ncbi:MAG: geranylgeranyl reductase family protein [Flavobacteriaceae bacterium]|nr:geranylgeranyl reductase family protein [Flavobacteriaceae bacterium]